MVFINSCSVGICCCRTFRLVLDRGCEGLVNLQFSAFSVSDLAWGSGVSKDPPPDEGKMPSDRGLSLLVKKKTHYAAFIPLRLIFIQYLYYS